VSSVSLWFVSCCCLLACTGEPDPIDPPIDGTLAAHQVRLSTTLGDLTLQLHDEQAPVTVTSFLDYIDAGFYDGADGEGATIFHRVIPGFVVQGGGLTESLDRKATEDGILNESDNGLSNLRGTVAMARTGELDSATSQFFVNLVDNTDLDAPDGTRDGYTVFAQVIEGMDVADTIATTPTSTQEGMDDVPVQAVIVTGVSRGERP
jgi:peptidyl-prolyl cis-trans isomerase A (cyclophilin A)